MNKTLRIDSINVVLIIASCILAHFLPYHLVLFSYAVLGPAHYLTQISWMYDRKYFVNQKFFAPILVLLTFVYLALPAMIHLPNRGAAMATALVLAISFLYVLPPNFLWRVFAATIGALLTAMCFYSSATALFIAVLLPTVCHIFLFTACFMWAGALRSGKFSSYLPIIMLFACAATFLIPSPSLVQPNMEGLKFFEPVAAYLKNNLPFTDTSLTQFFGFLSFAYTYHYLNWFSKAEVIHWHKIPRARLAIIVLVYIVAIGIYMVDYFTGFLVIFFLAQLHVFLEFPLNMKTFALIGTSLHAGTLGRKKQAAPAGAVKS